MDLVDSRMLGQISMMGKMIPPEKGTFNHLWAVSAPWDAIKPNGLYESVGVFFGGGRGF